MEILCKQSVLLGRANAIRPKKKVKRGRMGKYNLGVKAKWGGLVKELGCQIVTRSYSANCYILHSANISENYFR